MTNILKVRYQQIKNQVINQLIKFPLLSSLVILIPILLYLFIDLALPTELVGLKLNPNILELIQSFNVMFFLLERYLLVIVATFFIFFVRQNQQIFWKYKSYPVSFIDVTRANILSILLCVDIVLIFISVIIYIISNSSIISSVILFLLLLIGTNSTFIIAFCLYFSGTYFIKFILKGFSLIICALLSVIFFTIPILLFLNLVPFNIVLESNSILTIITLITLSIIPFIMFNNTRFKNKYFYNKYNSKKTSFIFLKNDNIGIVKNYFLLLLDNISVYVEYLIGFSLFVFIIVITRVLDITDLTMQSLIIINLLTSSGLIFHYSNWFNLRKKSVLKKTLLVDSLFYIILSIIYSVLLQVFLLKDESFKIFLILFISNLICLLSQRVFKLKFSSSNNTMLSFTLFYGVYSFLIVLLVKVVI